MSPMPSGFGTMILNELDQLVAFKEKGLQTGLVNLGAYGLNRSIFERLSFTSGNFSFRTRFPASGAGGGHAYQCKTNRGRISGYWHRRVVQKFWRVHEQEFRSPKKAVGSLE